MEHVTVEDLLRASGGTLLFGNPHREISHIKLDSRKVEPGDLFVPIIGERVDGHSFILQTVKAGAAAVFTSEEVPIPEEDRADVSLIQVEDTKKALQDVGTYLRKRLSLPLVGVTGSVGKTTTREMIAAALSARFHVYKTPGNSNSQVGVPITISEISAEHEVGVIELGMSEPGEMTVIAKIAQIDMAVITNIGITHIGQLGSRENIFKEKMAIQDGLKDGGLLILNGDDDMLKNAGGRDGIRTVYYGTGPNCDYRAEDVCLLDDCTEFTAVCRGKRQRIHLNVMGQHNVMNALAAIAVCDHCGMSMEEAARGLFTCRGFKNRQQIYENDRYLILDDSYNACPESMKAAFSVFKGLKPENRHVAVLAEMRELGEESDRAHREVGRYAAEAKMDLLVTLGAGCHVLAETFSGISDAPVKEFLDKEEMVAYLDQALKPGDCILFKGANSMGLFTVADRYIGDAKNR